MATQFLYQFHPGDRPGLSEGPDEWTEDDMMVGRRHAAYLEGGVERRIVVMAGRCQDWVGPAIVILEAESEEEARAFMEADPFVAEGLFTATLHPFRVAMERE